MCSPIWSALALLILWKLLISLLIIAHLYTRIPLIHKVIGNEKTEGETEISQQSKNDKMLWSNLTENEQRPIEN